MKHEMTKVSDPAAEIVQLHSEIIEAAKTTLNKALRIGELLTEQKDRLPHGSFLPWVEASLPFTDRTARNYMKVFRERDRLKSESVSDLGEAYRLLAAPTADTWKPPEEFAPQMADLLPEDFVSGFVYLGVPQGSQGAESIEIGEYGKDPNYWFIHIYSPLEKGDGGAVVHFSQRALLKSSIGSFLSFIEELAGVEWIDWTSIEAEPGILGRTLESGCSMWQERESWESA